jgi:hypothetical protein
MKAWLYNHCVIARLAWPFMVYDFSVTSSVALTTICTGYLKKWLRITKTAVPEFLYLSKKHFGLGLKEISVFFKQMQVVRASLLKDSKDVRMVELYAHNSTRDATRDRWKPTVCLQQTQRDITIDAMSSRGQTTRHGVGFVPHKPPPAPGTHAARREVSLRIASDADAIRRVHLMGLVMQGEFMRWDDLMAQDMSWNRLIYGLSPSLLGFAMKSFVNMLPTPDNLSRWRLGEHPCKLCGARKPTPAHILSACPVALTQQRYTYRHDEVLSVLYKAVVRKMKEVVPQHAKKSVDSPVRFHPAGEKPQRRVRSPRVSLLDTASDWCIACDLSIAGPYTFPLTAAVTARRPDIAVWSESTKQLVLLELTVPNETRVVQSMQLKQTRYKELVDECSRTFATTLLTAEVGTRGFVASRTQQALQQLGIWSSELHKDLSNSALRGSHAIYLNRDNPVWFWNVPTRA